jgi:hypothetical protein
MKANEIASIMMEKFKKNNYFSYIKTIIFINKFNKVKALLNNNIIINYEDISIKLKYKYHSNYNNDIIEITYIIIFYCIIYCN